MPVSASPVAADLEQTLRQRMERQLELAVSDGEVRKTTFTLAFEGC